MNTLVRWLEWGGVKRDAAFLAVSIGALLVRFAAPTKLGFDAAWIAVILCGTPILLEAFIGLVTRFDIKADLLVSLALAASLYIGETFAAAEVAVIMQLGSLLEELTVRSSRSGMERLVRLSPRTARLVGAQGESMIPAESTKPGDTLRVLPGETVPADGVIVDGKTSVDESMLTGESVPVDKGPGDTVSGGTVNRFGSFDMQVETSPENSALQRMIRLVESADAGKAKIVGMAHMGSGDRAADGHCHLARHRRDPPLGDGISGILPLRHGARHTHRHRGGRWQSHPLRRAGTPGRRPGAPGKGGSRGF